MKKILSVLMKLETFLLKKVLFWLILRKEPKLKEANVWLFFLKTNIFI
ncbi:hypothetical protein BAPKO_0632 [Borreliella afzelii PKo]|nr:hypothetical protein BAPKO_0632 [Borreliella afzelii PKo]